ncbi:MAG: universal stress protein [Schwartzia sp.]|nr:universal stress protein [Schwartzia sp. (in: firmicutes)]MBR1759695.1 universal stress protein [Schwartzia sp. (in: firmicutes)]MBR1885087.1 universal stress protein [Schwartzia sp. (in: firmicutes)]
MNKILVSLDGSEISERACAKAVELAAAMKSKLVFLYVANVNQLAVHSCLSSELLEAVNKAGDVILTHAEENAPEGVETERVLETGSPAPTIVDVAEEIGADLIVMGSRGLGLVKGVFLGSVSQYVVENAKCAVMVVK